MTQFYERDRAWGIQVQPLGFLPPNVPDRVWGPPPPWRTRVRPVAQRLRCVALAGEMQGRHEALKQLDRLEELIRQRNAKLTPEQQSDLRTLRKLYGDYGKLRYDAPSVSEGEREQLRQHLDWFGDLALAPAGNADERDALVALAGGPVVVGVQVEPPDPELRQTIPGWAKFLAGFV